MRTLLTFFLVVVFVAQANAQSEFSLYRMNGNLPQANLINPAFYPNHKVVIGLPIISSIYASADNGGIAFRDIFKNSETDSLAVDTTSLFTKLKATNRMQYKESIQLFYFGLRGKRSYFSFAIHQVSEMRLNYPGDVVGWAIRGPGDSHYTGKPLDFSNFYGRGIAYNKVSINYAHTITSKLTIGARFNYLLGVAAGQSSKVSGSLTMSTDSVSINTGTLLAQTAGIDFFNRSNLGISDYKSYALGTKNKGMAWDFGATYNLTNNVTLSAAVNDLGFISWKDYTHSYQVNPVKYTFKGFDILDYLNQSSGQKFLQGQVDSLQNLANVTETKGGSFKTSLVGKFYGGVNFKVLGINNFSALLYVDLFQKRVTPALSLGYNLQVGRLLNTTLGITYQNGKINNIGAGIALKLLNFQIYSTSDRANSFLYPARASRGDVHTGINLVFGRAKKKSKNNSDKDKDDDKQEPEKTIEPTPEPKKDSVAAAAEPIVEPIKADTATAQPDIQRVEDSNAQLALIPAVVKEKDEPVIIQPQSEPVVNKPQEEALVRPEPVSEPKYEIVRKGNHRNELPVSNYVIVGAFRMKANAQQYSRMLKREGFENSFGFATEKNIYYVFVYKSSALEETRKERDRFREMSNFQFPQSWVLTVE
jgi:hypothetical protein